MPRFLVFLIATLSVTTNAFAFDVALGLETPLSPPSITAAPYEQHLSDVASNGRDFLAIWLDRRATVPSLPYIYGAVPLYVSRLDRAGQPLNPFGLKLRDGAVSAALVFTSAGYMVLWSDNGETDSMLLDDEGAPISAPKRLADGYLIGAASNGRTIFVIHGPFSQPQFASVFSTDGALLSRTSIDPENRYPARQNRQSVRPMIMPNGDYGFVAETWHCPGNVACAVTATLTTISESGGVTTRALGPLSQWSQSAAAIGNGRLLLAWMNDNNTSRPARSLAFRIFDAAGNALNVETTIAATNDVQLISGYFGPSVGWDGQEFLVAWQWPSVDGQSGEIRAVRITMDGVVIDGSPMILSAKLGNPPWFASSSTGQLLAWDTFVYGTSNIAVRTAVSFDVLAYAGTMIIPESAALQTEVQLATLRTGKLAVWREGDSNPSIVASLIGGAPVAVSPSGEVDQQTPSVGASRDQYLVVWREQAFSSNSKQSLRILGKRLSSNGPVLDSNPIVIAQAPGQLFAPAANTLSVGSNGIDFFVVWTSSASADLLSGARVSSTGAVLDPTPIDVSQPPNGTPGSPRVVWNGSQYVVAWTSDPSCKLCLSPPGPPVSQIFVARVTPDGKLVDSQMIWKGGYGSRVALARGANGLMLSWGISADTVSNQACVYTMALRDDGVPSGSTNAVTCTASSSWPQQFPDLDIAWDGAAFVVAWTQLASTTKTAARAIRVSRDGIPLDGAPFEMGTVESESSFQPALASSAGGVVIAYDRIATEPQYGGVARIFTRALQAQNIPRRRAAR